MKFRKYLLFTSVFVCGMCVMIVELVGSRLFAPFFGTGIYVWTVLIGVILGAMAIGYALGGRMADKNSSLSRYSVIISVGALLTAYIIVFGKLISTTMALILPNTVGAILAALFLFVPVAVALGLVSPYAVKLAVKSLEISGRTVGSLYAASTLGSITGTFIAGFALIPLLSNTVVLAIVSIVLAVLALVVALYAHKDAKIVTSITLAVVVLFAVLAQFLPPITILPGKIIAEGNTRYSYVTIYDHNNIRTMLIDNSHASGRYLDSDALVYEYSKAYEIARELNNNIEKTLMIGGAGYSYPQHFLKNYTGTMDVVEIDSGVTALARKYFGLKNDPRLKIFHQDARIFLNKNETEYDVIYGDAFAANTPPYQLCTLEATKRIYKSLADDGIFAVNTIDRVAGGKFFESYYSTLAEVFPHILVFLPQSRALRKQQNIVMFASKNAPQQSGESSYWGSQYHGEIGKRKILTDNHSPVETLTGRWW